MQGKTGSSSMTEAQSYYSYRGRRRRHAWVRRAFIWLFAITFILPAALVLLFRFVPPPLTPLMLMTWADDGSITQQWVPLDSISPNLVRAVIASEDSKFCSHSGFDWQAIDKALAENASSSRLRGASTISQQTAKNLFLMPNRTWTRKGIEGYLTLLLEMTWPKRRIMEAYLNIAEWGPGRFGAEAAAEANFKKPAATLTVVEAARLASVLPNPRLYRADAPGPYVARQAGVVAARMAQVERDRLDRCIYP